MGFFRMVWGWFHEPKKKEQRRPTLMLVVDNDAEEKEEQKRQEKPLYCPHGVVNYCFKITVFGAECSLDSSPMCEFCTGEYLNRYASLCADCGGLIFPGDPVGQAWNNAAHPYTHFTPECCEARELYAGKWGEGRLIETHERFLKDLPEFAPCAHR
jgi:hypothetical protein